MSYNPWRELRERAHLTFALADLPPDCGGGAYVVRDGRGVILVDRRLDYVGRRCTLTHELIHDEMGGARYDGAPASWDAVVARDEAAIDLEAARRLIPAEELRRLVAGAVEMGEAVTRADVAEAFDVTEHLAERAPELVAEGWAWV